MKKGGRATPHGMKALDPSEGEALWAAGSLMVVKATSEDTHGGFTLIEQECPPGLDSPEHMHETEDQCFYILAGSMDVSCGDSGRSLTEGCFAVLPRGVPHSFTVGPEGVRFLSLTTPGGFENFAREIGSPAMELTTPPNPAANLRDAGKQVVEAPTAHSDVRPATQ